MAIFTKLLQRRTLIFVHGNTGAEGEKKKKQKERQKTVQFSSLVF